MIEKKVYISLGSNIGHRRNYIQKAKDVISQTIAPVEKESSIYETDPWGEIEQAKYLNQIIQIKSTLKPIDLLQKLLKIELSLGRIRKEKNGPRTIDIDILLMDNLTLNTSHLIIPHPRIRDRKFILVPLAEITDNLIHPILKLSIQELLLQCKDIGNVSKLKTYEIKS